MSDAAERAEGAGGDGLRILDDAVSCEGCGDCCLELRSPPGYLDLMAGVADESWPEEDRRRVEALPAAAREELERYARRIAERPEEGFHPCIWLDVESRRCRWYEHRPYICRSFPAGCGPCLTWRREYGVSAKRGNV